MVILVFQTDKLQFTIIFHAVLMLFLHCDVKRFSTEVFFIANSNQFILQMYTDSYSFLVFLSFYNQVNGIHQWTIQKHNTEVRMVLCPSLPWLHPVRAPLLLDSLSLFRALSDSCVQWATCSLQCKEGTIFLVAESGASYENVFPPLKKKKTFR